MDACLNALFANSELYKAYIGIFPGVLIGHFLYYVRSAERFDPRECSWRPIKDMSTKRGGHSLVVLNEKL